MYVMFYMLFRYCVPPFAEVLGHFSYVPYFIWNLSYCFDIPSISAGEMANRADPDQNAVQIH